MKYRVRHVTTYQYGSPVTFAHCTLTLVPRNGPGQTVESVELSLTPKPMALTTHHSFFGHDVSTAQIDIPHRELRIDASSVITVNRPGPDLTGALFKDEAWSDTARSAVKLRSMDPDAPVHYLFPSPLVPLSVAVTAYTQGSFSPRRPTLEAATELMQRIHDDFRYAPDATKVSTPLAEAFEQRHGVCQDYAHIMIAGLRGLGLPARYVSGYIRTIPPKDQARLEGADATHAWIETWCGRDLGWVGLDPTNAIRSGDDHIVLATGRDYADVAPVGGIILGTHDQDITVNVDVVPIG